MNSVRPLVSVVDDDESVRESLPDLLRQFGYAVRAFSSAEEFLASDDLARTDCLLLDVAMPGMTGPDHPSAPPGAGRRGLPVQAVQRGGAARGGRSRDPGRGRGKPLAARRDL